MAQRKWPWRLATSTSVGEFKIVEREEELKVVATNLKLLEVSEDKGT